MGLLSGILGGSQKTNVPATGYYSLPGDLKSQYTTAYNAIPGATTPEAFTLPGFNADQLQARGMARGAANPTAQSINDLLQAYMNPYNESVIGGINREAQGSNSILKKALNEAGQLGSNRGMLSANDIDLTRQNQIGQFLQSQFNTALQTGLGQQQQGIQNLSAFGDQEQQQQFQNQQAPYNALAAHFGLLNPVVSYVGGSTPQQTIKTGGGLGGLLGGISNIGSIFSGLGGIGSSYGLWGGLDPSSGITWNSGRY